jgi:hypothetical protein
LLEDADWTVIEPPAGQHIWTDDYSNVIGAVIRHYWRAHPPLPEPEKSVEQTPPEPGATEQGKQ